MSITTKKENKQSKGVAGSGLTQKELKLAKKLKNIRSAKPASRFADEFDMDDMSYKPLNLSEEQLLKRAMDSLLANREKKFMKDGGLAEATAKLKAKGLKEGGMVVKDKIVAIDKSPNSGLITTKGFGAGRRT